jgi:hypothetical protein
MTNASYTNTKKLVCAVLITSTIFGCGRAANPVATYHPTDQNLSCNSLVSAMDESENSIRRLLPKSEKTGKNVALGVAGAFFLVPWFFMDFSDAEKIEIEAHRSRYNHLARLYDDKQCFKTCSKGHVKELPDFFADKNESKEKKTG